MSLDERARRAAGDIRREVGDPETAPSAGKDPFERFERSLSRRTRNQRIGAAVVALAIAVLGIVFVTRALGPERSAVPATPGLPGGTILYGEWDQRLSQARWFTVDPDGSNRHELGVIASCASWFSDGSRILITNDADRGPETPLRPAVIRPDGSGLRSLDATQDPDLELGCGDVSPDGSRIVLEGFNEQGVESLSGIYAIRASDGGGLQRITTGLDGPPQFSPDGTRIVFMRTKPGVQPDGAGALFVVRTDGSGLRRITPWGSSFLDRAWSPDGRWIAFQRPYGELYLVRPDGTDLHPVPVELPSGAGARQPEWSPDGEWIVFALERDGSSDIFAVRPDGTDLTEVTRSPGADDTSPDWAP
jgi:Tol biopolymer transport system component